MIDRGGQLIVGFIEPLVVLGSMKTDKHPELGSKQDPSKASASAPASRFLSYLSSCPDSLQWRTTVWKCKLNKPLPPQLAFDYDVPS